MAKRIALTNSDKFAIVDDSLFDFLNQFTWYLSSHGYACRTQYVSPEVSHLVLMHHHVIGNSKMTDHWDGNKLNNQFLNLRHATMAQNKFNAGKHRDNTSGYKGVSWHLQRKKWVAQIAYNGKKKYIGLFTNKIEAAKAYDREARLHHGVYAKLNFP